MRRGCQLSTAQLHHLDLAVLPLVRLTKSLEGPCGVYLVGTVNTDRDFRDVDVRMILADEAFDALFGHSPFLWETFSYAVTRWLAADTGLPIDFQVQRMTEANAEHAGIRNPLTGGRRRFAALGDATPFTDRECIDADGHAPSTPADAEPAIAHDQ